ncbi:hypothetical protein [Actinomadura sp. DC4]|uniref:hypothetical protein n=1 Tax=Actinomadura sp. DC4 TaxID=3055069 RepID=UPI0025B07359|nr:hypothetical protein [Actinomadura sp. DC4]MDN3358961.1 hypothetical protein [Actinomadura sp. DC4]
MDFRRIHVTGRHRRFHRAVLAVAFAAAPYGPATAAGAKPKGPPALRIGIDNGHTSVRTGDRLTYVTKVTNTGTTKTPDLLLTQTLVPGLKLITSAPKGELSGDRITWNRALATGRTDRFSVTVEVGRLAQRTQRLAAVVCASAKTDKRPIVCASHLDVLRDAATDGSESSGPVSGWVLWSTIAGAVVSLVAGAVLLLRRRRKTRSVL